MTGELGRDSGDHVIVLHVHEFAHGRFGRMQVDCDEGGGEGWSSPIVSGLQAAGVSAEGEIRDANYGHIAAAILKVAAEHDARHRGAGLQQPHRPAPHAAGQRG